MAESKQNDQRLRKEKFNRRLDRRERLRRRKRDVTRVRYVGRGINPAQVRRLRALKRDSDPRDTFFEKVVDTGPRFVPGKAKRIRQTSQTSLSYNLNRRTPRPEPRIGDLLTPESPIEELERSMRELLKNLGDLDTPSPPTQQVLSSPSARPRAPAVTPAPPLPPLQDSELASSPSALGESKNKGSESPWETKSRTPRTPGFQSVIL